MKACRAFDPGSNPGPGVYLQVRNEAVSRKGSSFSNAFLLPSFMFFDVVMIPCLKYAPARFCLQSRDIHANAHKYVKLDWLSQSYTLLIQLCIASQLTNEDVGPAQVCPFSISFLSRGV